MIAEVQLTHTKTAFGFRGLQRATIRTCIRPSELAREIQMREFLREMMRQELAMTHIN